MIVCSDLKDPDAEDSFVVSVEYRNIDLAEKQFKASSVPSCLLSGIIVDSSLE